MITKRFTIIYLALAPIWFALSWYISHRLQLRFMSLATNELQTESNNKPFIYASIFTALYVGSYLVIRDLYKPAKSE
jgi:hypothetical protein